MELAFVISALRRRFWVVTLLALLGSLPGLTSDPPVSNTYRATATLLVQPPTRSTVNLFSTDPDRYVVSQLSVIGSESLANDVAQRASAQLGVQLSGRDAALITDIDHSPGTDIVGLTTTAITAELAAAVAQGYAELYVEGLATNDEDAERRSDLERQIETLDNRLNALDERLQIRMEPFLPEKGDPTPDPIPPAEVVDPSAVSQRQLVQAELQQLIMLLNDLDQQSRLQVNTTIISDASIPTEPLPPRGNFLLAGGLAAGIILGVVLALMWARFSNKVLDEDAAGVIIGAPVVSEVPHYRSLSRTPLAAFQALPRSAIPVIDQLCVRAEALARIGEPLTVAVTGTMRSAGSTTLALAMAERFAAGGASVVLVDADVRDPRVTALFNATADGGVPAVIANHGSLTDQRGRSALTRTMDPAVSVLGLGPNRGSAALRRDTVPDVLDAARRNGEIVVIDGGPVLDLASTLQFAALVDAVVLAVPLSRQKADALTDMARQLGSVRAKLLPVVTSPSRRAAKGEVVRADGAIAVSGRAVSSVVVGGTTSDGGAVPGANPGAAPPTVTLGLNEAQAGSPSMSATAVTEMGASEYGATVAAVPPTNGGPGADQQRPPSVPGETVASPPPPGE